MVKALVVLIVISACGYDLSVENCAVVCATDDSACPEGFTCGPEGRCRTDMTSECVLASDALGGVITHVAGRTIHTFDASWSGTTFTPPPGLSDVDLLVVGGGGGGGSTRGGGGGGAGGLVFEHVQVWPEVLAQPFQVLVGDGGSPGVNGGDSVMGGIRAFGGGAGRPSSPANGGSGGGVCHDTNGGGAGIGTTGQGNSGGPGGFNNGSTAFTGGGGGGAGGTGASGASSQGGGGGLGLAFEISGTHVFYAGGGGGAGQDDVGGVLAPGVGGVGGGGDGGINAIGKEGADGTGGGGGGGGGGPDPDFFDGGRGGNGVVIVSYPTQR